MKRCMYLSIGVLCLMISGLIGFHIGTETAVAQQFPIGRYQLIPATYTEYVKGRSTAQSTQTVTVFRLDTSTGEAWRYSGWIDLDEQESGTYWAPCESPNK